MSLTIRGVDGIGGELEMPLRGVWTYEGDVDASSFALGHAVVSYTGKRTVTFAGTVIEASTVAARTKVRIVGGAGGLRETIPALGYRSGTPASTVAKDIAIACREALADGVLTALRDHILASGFHRTLGTGKAALDNLCDTLGAGWNWRVLGNGTVWIGLETWPSFSPAPFQEKEPDEHGVAIYAGDQPDLTPGVNVDGRRLSSVKHSFSGSLRTYATLLQASANGSPTGGAVDRDREAKAKFVKGNLPDYDRLPHYGARVIDQDGDGALNVKSNDPRLGDAPSVPVFFGVPGVASVTLGAGVEVKIAFDGARTGGRFAHGFAQGSEVEELVLHVTRLVIEADEIVLGDGSAPVLRSGDTLVVPVGAAGTPTPMPITLAPTVTEYGPPPGGKSRVSA